ncbi:transglutaminase-like domain-containing protein [Methylovulum miyakonense]|uniref:transglutaminase-like domain-containing protein n=1 Tax=Methylovulum miyakonense TaxID=645578 RepID=UPI0003696B9A|nr:transglutaminase domain-containing protein [Methylovulum miyakonense]
MFTARSLRPISGTTLFFFLWMTLFPAVSAAVGQSQATPTAAQAAAPAEPDTLDSLRELAGRAHAKADRGEDESDEAKQLLDQADKLDTEEQQAEAEFAQTRKHLEDHHLPDEIKQRHAEALAGYRAKMKQLKQLAQGFKAAHGRKDRAAARQQLKAMADFLGKEQKHRRHQPFDPKHLPFGTPDGNVRAPKETKQELDDLVRPPQAVAVAANELLPGMLAQNDPGATPTADDLAATEDAPLTDAIKAQAAALHHNPVEIYNWVRNSVEFLPTYGSIQGSDLTLQTLRGNAFDTASLLVSLLRASNIPARYVYGTIQIPAAQVMNWVGGVTTAEAAQDLLGQGGIPTVAVKSGGKIAAFRLEHVWVEAFVDYIPSRGAVNKQGDTWVPMDAAFKQYSALPSLIPSDISSGMATVASNFMQSANQASDGSWSTGYDANLLSGSFELLQTRISGLLEANPDKISLDEIIGGRAITVSALPILLGTLPYAIVAKATQSSVLPENTRVMAQIELRMEGPYGEEAGLLLSKKISLASLGYGSVNLSHAPATVQDANIWASYTNAGATDFPSYLVKVKPQLAINGTLVADGPMLGIGQDLLLKVTLGVSVNTKTAIFRIVSGDEMEIGINGSGQSALAGLSLKDRSDLATAEGNLYVANKVFWTQQDFQDRLFARLQGVAVTRLPSVGIFASPISVLYSFGIPRRASYHSRQVDVKLSSVAAVALDGNPKKTATFLLNSGMMSSATEGAAIEEVFSKPLGHGSNTMRLLQLANEQKIPIYHLTTSNIAANRAALQHTAEVMADIDNALNAGLEVIIPKSRQTNGAWSGSGYIMLNPNTGAADYRVSGGLSGNFDDECKRSTEPVKVTVPDIALIWIILFAWMVDDDFNFNSDGIAQAFQQIMLVEFIVGTTAYQGVAVAASGSIVRSSFQAIEVALFGMEVAVAAAEDSCSCEPKAIKRRGGTSKYTIVHNMCADRFTDDEYINKDVEVSGVAFDSLEKLINPPGTLYEIKTGMFYRTIRFQSELVPGKKKFLEFLKAKAIYGYYRERIAAQFCDFEFLYGLKDPVLLGDMQDFFIEAGRLDEATRIFDNQCQ